MKRLMKKILYLVHGYYHEFFGLLNSINQRLNGFIPIYPSLLRIRITSKCNLHCSFCYLSGSLNQKEVNGLSAEEWSKVISRLPFYTVVDITGAEPTLSPHLGKVLTIALDKKIKVSMTTNGMNTNDEFVDLIVRKKLTYLMISVDDYPEEHNSVRGHNKSFSNIKLLLSKIEAKKKELKTNLPLINIKTTVLDNNLDHLHELHTYIRNELNPTTHSFNLGFANKARGGVISYGDQSILEYSNTFQYRKAVSPSIQGISQLLKERGSSISVRPFIEKSRIQNYIRKPSDFGVKTCSRYQSVITLNYDGSLSFCDINYQFGNIRDLDFDLRRVWKNENFRNFSRKLKKRFPFTPACEGCCLAPHEEKLK